MVFKEKEGLLQFFDHDCIWIVIEGVKKHPDGKQVFDPYKGRKKISHGDAGCLTEY